MEVKLDKKYPVAASPAQAWAVLSDIRATAACMPGAQITEQVDDTHYKGSVRSKVGPAVMTFNGDIEVLGLDAGQQRLQMLGKGADKSGSSASMNLTAFVQPGETPATSVLAGQAVITVSGKLAQFCSRLLVPVSDAMLAQFADNFRAAAAVVPLPGAAPAAGETPVAEAAGAGAAPAGAPAAATASAAPRPVKELNALALMWVVIKNWFAGLFGKKAS
jgi:uncharacterized protein